MKTYLNTHLEDVILPLIESAEEKIFVCSPYITSKYANILVEKCQLGIDTRVVTTDVESNYHQEALDILYGGDENSPFFRKITVGLLVLAVISGFLSILSIYWVILTVIFGVSAYWAWREEEAKLDLQINSNLHAKLFSADGKKAVVGSCNLTERGLAKNMEFAMKLEGKQAKRVIHMFEEKMGHSR